ncbi:XRCC4-like factor-domain-containing protein [Xylariales sp. PMI_506]|nr:XRCC4-like factor-domain-containing protein [Xylariales sp. PMI_506]
MSQMIPMRWRPLPVFDGLPALLVAPNFGTATYTLHVTDLTNIWSETLDRKGVVRRSLNEDTSIDPTEGADQMAMLLSKLQAAFDPSAADYRQTSVGLSKPSHDDEGKILLTVTCTLPGGLKPLRWPFELSKLPAMSLASELVLPLIQAQHARIWEIRHLITLLEQKDAIIGKLSDKLESVGITLDTVFNPLSGKKKVTRELAEEKVQGFAPFQKADWQSRGLAEDEKPTDVSSLIREAFLEPSITLDKDLGVSDDLQDWWTTKLKSSSVIVAKSEELAVPAGGITNAPKTTSHTKDDNDDDDDFQVQATPPHLAARKAAGRNNDHDTTTDEDSETEAIPDSLPPAPENKKPRLGAIGKPKKELPEASTPPPGQPSRQHQDVADDTASESDTEPTRSPPQKRNVRLGAIGKRRQEETSSATKSASTLEQGDPDDATASESEEEAAPSKPKSPTPPREPSPRANAVA